MIEGPLEKGIKFRLTPIDNGTVLDHLPVGSAPKIVQLLGLEVTSGAVTMAINTESRGGASRKDLLFIENLEMTKTDLEKIGLICHDCTWNTIQNKKVVRKEKIFLPSEVVNVLKCLSPACITNAEPIPTRFAIRHPPLSARCHYCERTVLEQDLLKSLK